jgi:AcrR family transcriptional regulator
MPKGIALTEEAKRKKRKEIFNAAIDTFLKKGFVETSMREIAELAGMGKSSLYDYYKTKEDMLIYFAKDSLDIMIATANEIAKQEVTAYQRLNKIMLAHLEHIVSNKKLFLLFYSEGQRMSSEAKRGIQKERYVYQDLISKIIEDGIMEGSLREVDPLVTTRLLINAIVPAVFTSRPTGTPQEMLEESMDVFLKGIQA